MERWPRLMSKKVYLHIGYHKTGTTFLQKTLYENRENLLKQGFLYPKAGVGIGYGHALLSSVMKLSTTKTTTRTRQERKDHHPEKYWKRIRKEIQASTAQSVIISSELFHMRNDLTFIKKHLNEFDIQIIVYLRRQDHYLLSLYNQRIKGESWRLSITFEEFVAKAKSICNYKNCLDNFSQTFGKENITVRLYEKIQLPNGLLEDYANTIGFSTSNFTVSKKKINQSHTAIEVELFRIINKSDVNEFQYHSLYKKVELLRASNLFKENNHSIMSPALAFNIVNSFAAENETIAKEYLNREDGRLFFESPPNPKKAWEDPMALNAEDLMLGAIAPLLKECLPRYGRIRALIFQKKFKIPPFIKDRIKLILNKKTMLLSKR